MTDDIRAVFQRADCEGTLCVQSLGGDAEVALRSDEPVIPASVIKVLTASRRRHGSPTAAWTRASM